MTTDQPRNALLRLRRELAKAKRRVASLTLAIEVLEMRAKGGTPPETQLELPINAAQIIDSITE